MYNVLIVDDDFSVRANIKLMLCSMNSEYVFFSEAFNGLEALRTLESSKIDIVISDVCMPQVNGVELSMKIKESYPNVVIIIISNYDDFDYVKETLKNGAIDYLLKHELNKDILLESLERAKWHLLNRETDRRGKEAQQLLVPANIAALKQKFIINLLTKLYTNVNEIQYHIKLLNIHLHMKNVVSIIMEIDEYKRKVNDFNLDDILLIELSIVNIAEEILHDYDNGCVCHLFDKWFVLLLSFENTHSTALIDSMINEILNRMANCFVKFLNISVTFGIGEICRSILDVHKSYKIAWIHLEDKFYIGKSKIIKNKIYQDYSNNSCCGLDIETEKKIMSLTELGEKEELIVLLDKTFQNIKQSRISLRGSELIFNDLLGIINRLCKKYSIELQKVYDALSTPYKIMDLLETLEEGRGWFLSSYKILIDLIKTDNMNGLSKHVFDAVQIIKKEYMKDISLNEIAERLNISSSYLSKIFKEETKKNIIEYLNECRVEKAKILLSQEHKNIRNIALSCGFTNYNYFFTVFKNITGLTTKQYIKIDSNTTRTPKKISVE